MLISFYNYGWPITVLSIYLRYRLLGRNGVILKVFQAKGLFVAHPLYYIPYALNFSVELNFRGFGGLGRYPRIILSTNIWAIKCCITVENGHRTMRLAFRFLVTSLGTSRIGALLHICNRA